MTDYTETFSKIDGNMIEAADFETEFQAIAAASATKFDKGADFGTDFAGGTITDDTVSTAPGTATVDFTGFPSLVKRVTLIFDNLGMSANTGVLELQLGTSGGIDTTADYSWQYTYITSAAAAAQSSNATFSKFRLAPVNGATTDIFTGRVEIVNIAGNVWVIAGLIGNVGRSGSCSGRKALGGVLTQLRVLNSSANTFDTGSINIFYEG